MCDVCMCIEEGYLGLLFQLLCALYPYSQHKVFQKKLAKALQLDTATAQILSGEFAEEAILVKADQLAKQEVSCLLRHAVPSLHVVM